MSDLDLDAIKARLRNVDDNRDQCRQSPGQVSLSGYIAAAMDTSRDVPTLVAEVERLQRLLGADPFPTSDGYEAAMQALTDERAATKQLRAVLDEILRNFYEKGHPGYEAYRSNWVRAESLEKWRRIASTS